ncbi:MAG: sugar transferase [Patescibacteria group bacterium]|jgi:exopolysaccharide biosynthesis polyprenyl glycosylphosphotransferase
MKKADFIINIALVPIDYVTIVLAAISAYYLRFSAGIIQIRPATFELAFLDYFHIILQIALLAIFVFAWSGFYTMRSKKIVSELPRIISGVSTTVIFLILAIFFQRELFASRFIIISAWVLAIVYLLLVRIIVILVKNYFLKLGRGLSAVIIVGRAADTDLIIDAYNKNKTLGYKIVGQYDNLAQLKNAGDPKTIIKDQQVEYIMQTDSSMDKDEALDLLTFCQENHINLKYIANLFQAQSLNLELNSIFGLPLIEIKGTPLDGWRRVYKRIFDLCLAFLFMVVLSPFLVIIAMSVALSSSGPIIVRLKRVGQKGKVFEIYKFRSMVKDAHLLKDEVKPLNERVDGPLFKMKNDPRVTKLGKFLRRTSLDELPQLYNVLKGQMSLVGPRPHEPEEVSQYQRGYRKLLTIKPGITGMAQVSGRSNLLFSDEAKLDIFYIENWSILLDLIILLKTPKALFKKDEAC